VCFALFSRFSRGELLAGITNTAASKVCNEYKTLSRLGLNCVKMLGHECTVVFQTAIFVIPFSRNNKKVTIGINSKPATAFPEFVYITVTLSN